ncbi:hypothetical protein CC80DRAFT_503518 [Byssothecium circinans]|uniref:Osmotin, thaumatin-like protein n=1 Tax=Byssothecium circinans TaxID=147558 RepID=A0A6A5U0Z0_9PLEO|nr:hypothetical protein CC80DRAFT_503518 [Byssothecium circinans]
MSAISSFSKFGCPSMRLLIMDILLLFLFSPTVYSNCVDLTVTETVWVTETAIASGPPPSSAASVGPLTPSVQAPSPSSSTIINRPPSQSGGAGPSATFNPLPSAAILKTSSPENFKPLINQPGLAVIKNSCNYTLMVTSVGCGDGVKDREILAGEAYTEPLRSCPPPNGSGTQLQITSKTHTKPMLVEYGIDDQDGIFYDLSFLICMTQQSTDLTGCAGWEHGHQCGSGKGCPVFACQPGEYCDRTSYTTHEYGLTEANKVERQKVAAPVGRCPGAKTGVVWEVCASGRDA